MQPNADDVLLSAPQTRLVSLSFAASLASNPSTTMARAAALLLALLVGATMGEYFETCVTRLLSSILASAPLGDALLRPSCIWLGV